MAKLNEFISDGKLRLPTLEKKRAEEYSFFVIELRGTKKVYLLRYTDKFAYIGIPILNKPRGNRHYFVLKMPKSTLHREICMIRWHRFMMVGRMMWEIMDKYRKMERLPEDVILVKLESAEKMRNLLENL